MKTKNKVVKMTQRRRLLPNMVTVHNKPFCKCITFNQVLSQRLMEEEFYLVTICQEEDGTTSFYFQKKDHPYFDKAIKINYIVRGRGGKPTATMYNNDSITSFCRYFNLGEGDYYFKISEKFNYMFSDLLKISIEGVIDKQPLNDRSDSLKIENSVDIVDLSKATDQQLWDELKRRGYEGEVTKHMK